MKIFEYVTYISLLVWLIVPIRQYRNKHFYFFLILGLNDALGLFLWKVLSLSSQMFWIPAAYLLVFSIDKQLFFKKKVWVAAGLIPAIILSFYSTTSMQHLFVLLFNIVILFLFLKYFVEEYFREDTVNLLYITLILYQLIVVFKFTAIVSNLNLGLEVFYAGTIVQVVIGLYLIFVKKDIRIPKGLITK